MKTRNGKHGTTGARRKTRRTALLAAAGALLAAASALAARETPLHNARLSTDLNAGGHAVTNLAPPAAAADAATRGYVDAKTDDVPATVTNVVEGVVDESYVSSRARQISQKKNGIYTRVAIGDDNVPYVEVPPKKASKLVPDGSPFATSNAVTAALAPYAKRTEIPTVPTKVSAFENDAGYLTGESDPTVPAWAKAAKKPTYTASEVNAYTKTQTDAAISSATSGLASVTSVTSALALKADKSELAAVTNAVRETVRETGALFWDEELEVTWQGRFEGGYLYYVPVTNVNVTGRD